MLNQREDQAAQAYATLALVDISDRRSVVTPRLKITSLLEWNNVVGWHWTGECRLSSQDMTIAVGTFKEMFEVADFIVKYSWNVVWEVVEEVVKNR